MVFNGGLQLTDKINGENVSAWKARPVQPKESLKDRIHEKLHSSIRSTSAYDGVLLDTGSGWTGLTYLYELGLTKPIDLTIRLVKAHFKMKRQVQRVYVASLM